MVPERKCYITSYYECVACMNELPILLPAQEEYHANNGKIGHPRTDRLQDKSRRRCHKTTTIAMSKFFKVSLVVVLPAILDNHQRVNCHKDSSIQSMRQMC